MLRFLLRVPIVSSDTAFRLAVVQNSLVTKILVHYSLSLSILRVMERTDLKSRWLVL